MRKNKKETSRLWLLAIVLILAVIVAAVVAAGVMYLSQNGESKASEIEVSDTDDADTSNGTDTVNDTDTENNTDLTDSTYSAIYTEEEIEAMQLSSSLSGAQLDLTVTNGEEAMEALDAMSFYYGYENAGDVFEAGYEQDTGLFYVYYFTQMYEGLPVVGHSMKVIVDEDGNVLYFTGNYSAITDLAIDPEVEEAEAAEAAGIVDSSYTAELCVYIPEETAYLVWELKDGYVTYYVDAQTGELLDEFELLSYYDASTVEECTLTLTGQNSGDGLLEIRAGYVASEDLFYYVSLERNYKLYSCTQLEEDTTNLKDNMLVSFRNVEDRNTTAVDEVYNFNRTYDFYEDVLEHASVDGDGEAEVYLYADVEKKANGDPWTNNAVSGTDVTDQAAIIAVSISTGTYNNAYYLDVIAHEYTHCVQKFILGSDGYYTNQGNGVDEGIADIMAELCSAYYNGGKIDWFHENCTGGRNIADPSGTLISTYDQYDSSLDEHDASTLISHVAYLINTQPDLGSEYAISDYKTLAKLWYNAIYLMNAYSDFTDCRDAVERTAEIMMNKGELTYEQYLGAWTAFGLSGIPTDVETWIVDDSFEIAPMVVDYNNGCEQVIYEHYTAAVQSVNLDGSDDSIYTASASPENGIVLITDLLDGDSEMHPTYYLFLTDDYTDEEARVIQIIYIPNTFAASQTAWNWKEDENYSGGFFDVTSFGSSTWISGTVVDENGKALSDVKVTLENLDNWGQTAVVKTDENGKYRLFLYYETKEFTLTFSKDYYEEETLTDTLNAAQLGLGTCKMEEVTLESEFESLEYDVEEVYLEYKTTSGVVAYTNTFSYPVFTQDVELANLLNDEISEMIQTYKDNDTDWDETYSRYLEMGWLSEAAFPFYDNLEITVTYDSNGVISLLYAYTMWSGGYHSYYSMTGKIYEILSCEELAYTDILLDATGLDEYLAQSYTGRYITLDFVEACVLTEEGLCFYVWVGDAMPREPITVPFTSDDTYMIDSCP